MSWLRRWGWVGVVLVAAAGTALAAQPRPFDYAPYAGVLKGYVDDNGLVDYKGLKADRAKLDAFVGELADLDPAAYAQWDDKQKVAFWINAYNALVLRAVIDHYPIRRNPLVSFDIPSNSIRQIPGVWNEITFRVMGKEETLDGIENRLRKEFREPRVHVTLVFGAKGCPKLRREPYEGKKLDEQFAEQTRAVIADHAMFRINRERGHVALSPIFKWFGQDFVDGYGTSMQYVGMEAPERAVLNYLSGYLPPSDRAYLESGDCEVKFLSFDWALNEQKPGK